MNPPRLRPATLRYRILIYGNCRETGQLVKRVSWGRTKGTAAIQRHLNRAGETLIAPRLISAELTEKPLICT